MICPHCQKEIQLPTRASHNADAYGNIVVSVTDCCGKLVKLVPVRTYRIELPDPNQNRDDWGIESK